MSLLRDLGYTHVRHYRGGLTEWFADAVSERTRPADRDRRAGPSGPVGADAGSTRIRPAADAPLSSRFVDALGDRSVAELFWLWIAIVLSCGVAYWGLAWSADRALIATSGPLSHDLRGLLSAIYFSAVTATSVGYGDIVPTGVARVLAILEGVSGLILFGCVVSKFVSRRQEQAIGEIHRIAFEDRLGRVRTNLLLVRSEVQATARLCAGQEIPPPDAVARVESAAMVFVGELHAVHDLLYRPQQTPDEAVLEAILAGLTSVFREFIELLACIPARRAARPPALATSVRTMSRLAKEICGDCVPRDLAPGLRTWMDQIQRMAAEIEQI